MYSRENDNCVLRPRTCPTARFARLGTINILRSATLSNRMQLSVILIFEILSARFAAMAMAYLRLISRCGHYLFYGKPSSPSKRFVNSGRDSKITFVNMQMDIGTYSPAVTQVHSCVNSYIITALRRRKSASV